MQLPFSSTSAPISLYYNIPFSKDIGLASVLQQPFRTGSKHPKKWVALYTGLGTKNGNVTKKIFCRVLNRPSESRGSQPSGLLLVLFVEAKRINSFPLGNFLTSRKLAPVGTARCACFWFFLQKQKERKNVSLSGTFEVLKTSNQLTAAHLNTKEKRSDHDRFCSSASA